MLALALVVLVAAVATAVLVLRRDHHQASWHVVWSDEFSGSSLDGAKWQMENNSTFGEGNGELACLMNRPQNLATRDGVLFIAAQREPVPLRCGSRDARFPVGRSYTSAMISTKGRTAWHEGVFEIRAKLPTGPNTSRGLWPAFWMRPQSAADGTGEIDIFEAIGSGPNENVEASAVHQTLWANGAGHARVSTTTQVGGGGPAAAFHTYAVRWQGDTMTWLVDGKTTFVCDSKNAPWLAQAMRGSFYLRLNLAVGGSWPGAPTADTALPAAMVVDWVRVHQYG